MNYKIDPTDAVSREKGMVYVQARFYEVCPHIWAYDLEPGPLTSELSPSARFLLWLKNLENLHYVIKIKKKNKQTNMAYIYHNIENN